MDLLFFLKALYRKKWIILLLSFLATVATLFLVANKKPLYSSLAQFSTGFTSEKVKLVDGTSSVDVYTIDIKFDNVIETMKSPQVINRISYRLMLHDLEDSSQAYRKLSPKQMKEVTYREMNPDTAKKILRQKLVNNEQLRTDIKIERSLVDYLKLYGYDYGGILSTFVANRVDRTDYLNISFLSENPQLSAWVVNKVGDEFLHYYRNLNTQRTDTNSQRIQDLVSLQKARVDSIGNKLLEVKRKQRSFNPESSATSAMATVTELESALAIETGKYNEHANRVKYLRVDLAAQQAALNGGGSSDDVIRLTNKKNDLVAELNRKGGSDAVLEKQISDLRGEIAAKSGGGSNKTKVRENIAKITTDINEEEALMNAAKSTIADYSSRINRYKGMTNVDAGSEVEMGLIQSRLDIETRQLQNYMDKNTSSVALAKDDPTVNFIMTREGQPASQPESKKTFLKMILAGASVFFLSSVFFIFLQIFDSSVKTPTFFGRQSKLKMINVLNKLKLKDGSVTAIVAEEHEGKKYVQQNIFRNNIRKLRFEILKSGKQVFLFSSTQNKTGKSTVIEGLAASLLLSNKTVLILDLNFPHNTLTEKFGADFFIEDVTETAVKPTATQYPNLFILGCKKGNKTPAEALSGIKMDVLMKSLKEKYDFILIEGAALNYYADSKELSQYAEAVFIVYSADSSLTEVDHTSMKFIADLKEKNHGVILNKVLTENINS